MSSFTFNRISDVARRECGILRKNRMYLFCMVVFPVIVTVLFTSLMANGQPTDMPVGIVDLDNTPTTRELTRKLDAFQSTKITAHYTNVADARRAIQRNEIYAFLYIPNGTTAELLAMRQPKISFYYSSTSYTAGALLYRDLKTISTLGSASVGATMLSAKGMGEEQIMSILQPVVIDLHTINNPLVNYSIYLNTMLIPGCLMLFIFLVTAYSLGTEIKFNSAREWLRQETTSQLPSSVRCFRRHLPFLPSSTATCSMFSAYFIFLIPAAQAILSCSACSQSFRHRASPYSSSALFLLCACQ